MHPLRPLYKGSSETSSGQQSCYMISVHYKQNNPSAHKLSYSWYQDWTGNVSQGPHGMNNPFVILFQWTQRVSWAVPQKDPPCTLMNDISLRLDLMKSVLRRKTESGYLYPGSDSSMRKSNRLHTPLSKSPASTLEDQVARCPEDPPSEAGHPPLH